jgi:hypothetical protein
MSVELRRPLRDRDQPKTEGAAAPGDSVDFAKHPNGIAHGLLRGKGVRFLEHNPQRLSIDRKEVIEQFRH